MQALDDISPLSPDQELELQEIEKEKDLKKRETHLSELAYKLMAQASKRIEEKSFDEAIDLYDEAYILFSQLKWNSALII